MKKTIAFLITFIGMYTANASTLPTHSSEYYRHIPTRQTQPSSIKKSTPKPKTTQQETTTQSSDKFISSYRLGIDIIGGKISDPTTIKYGITDFYTHEKTSEYSFSVVGGAGFNFGLQHYKLFETELFADLYISKTSSAPAYYNYIYYPMKVSGLITTFGLREHYYYSFSEKFKLDLGIGVGGAYSSGSYIDKYEIEAYYQKPWDDTSFMYEGMIGFVYYPWDSMPIRFGYLRANFNSDYIGKSLNQFYFGIAFQINN